jgi:hypothetical protein
MAGGYYSNPTDLLCQEILHYLKSVYPLWGLYAYARHRHWLLRQISPLQGVSDPCYLQVYWLHRAFYSPLVIASIPELGIVGLRGTLIKPLPTSLDPSCHALSHPYVRKAISGANWPIISSGLQYTGW